MDRGRHLSWQKGWNVILVTGLAIVLGACTHELQTGLTEQEAQEIVVLMSENGIEASATKVASEKKGEEKWSVVVRGGDQNLARAWRVLQENGLPRQKDKGLEDVFSNAGMIPTATEEKARLLLGTSGEISRTLKSVDGIVDAHVLVVLPDNSPLLDKTERVAPTASVLIKYRGDAVPLSDEDVKKLVARAVEGLQPENVAVVYKKIESRHPADRNIIPLLGNQEILLASLGLLALTSVGSLALVGKSRWQRSKIDKLNKELAAQSTAAQAASTTTPMKMARTS